MGGWDDSPDYGSPPDKWWHKIGVVVLGVFVFGGAMSCAVQPSAQTSSMPFASLRVGDEFWGVATVSDADTIRIDGERIRLWGIDAPERDQTCGDVPAGELASSVLAEIAEGQRVFCVVKMRPSYNRAVAQCAINEAEGPDDDIDLAGAVIDAGWAWDSPEYSRGHYSEREAFARSRRIGVWALSGCETPWLYRQRARRRVQHSD